MEAVSADWIIDTFLPSPSPPGKRSGLNVVKVESVINSQFFNQSYLCNEVSLENQKYGDS